jgi:hypothetical protein
MQPLAGKHVALLFEKPFAQDAHHVHHCGA